MSRARLQLPLVFILILVAATGCEDECKQPSSLDPRFECEPGCMPVTGGICTDPDQEVVLSCEGWLDLEPLIQVCYFHESYGVFATVGGPGGEPERNGWRACTDEDLTHWQEYCGEE